MSRYTLGVDTSNYATSLAVFDTAGEVVCAKKRFLPVKPGQLGLRQSDALFHHTTALPEMLHELAQEFDLTRIDAVGVSQKPRPAEGSYMPCFLAGVNAATAFAAARRMGSVTGFILGSSFLILHAVWQVQGVVPAAPDGGIRWGSGLPLCGSTAKSSWGRKIPSAR